MVSHPGTLPDRSTIGGLRGAPPASPDSWSLVALLDVDDFVATRLRTGEDWADEQIRQVGALVAREQERSPAAVGFYAVEPDEWVVLLRGDDADALHAEGVRFAERLCEAVAGSTLVTATVSVGSVCTGVDQVERSLSAAVQANQRKLLVGGNRVILDARESGPACAPPAPERIENELSQRLQRGDRDGAIQLLREWVARSAELEGVTPEVLRSWLAAEILFAMNVVERRRLSDGSMDWVETFGRTSFDELLAMASIHEQSYLVLWLERLLERICGEASAERPSSGRHILALVEAYIAEHYAEDLSLSRVAQAVFVSPFYISHLFHRELDTTFLKYLTGIRIGKARQLLSETSLPVAAIAAQVGYGTAKNFRSVFKRVVGVTPTEYRGAESVIQ